MKWLTVHQCVPAVVGDISPVHVFFCKVLCLVRFLKCQSCKASFICSLELVVVILVWQDRVLEIVKHPWNQSLKMQSKNKQLFLSFVNFFVLRCGRVDSLSYVFLQIFVVLLYVNICCCCFQTKGDLDINLICCFILLNLYAHIVLSLFFVFCLYFCMWTFSLPVWYLTSSLLIPSLSELFVFVLFFLACQRLSDEGFCVCQR